MKTTSNGLPYPEDGDAADGPAQIKALAEALNSIPAKLLGAEVVETAKIKNLAVTAGKLAANAVETAKIKDGAVTDPKLASPNNAVWRTIYSAGLLFSNDAPAGTYIVNNGSGGFGGGSLVQVAPDSAVGGPPLCIFSFNPADYAVAGKTGKMRLLCQTLTNSTAPAGNIFKPHVFNIEGVSGVGDLLEVSFKGIAVTGPEIKGLTPGRLGWAGASQNFPASEVFALGVELSGGALVNNSAVNLSIQVQICHV